MSAFKPVKHPALLAVLTFVGVPWLVFGGGIVLAWAVSR